MPDLEQVAVRAQHQAIHHLDHETRRAPSVEYTVPISRPMPPPPVKRAAGAQSNTR